MDVSGLTVVADAFDVTFDEDVAGKFAGQRVDVIERHFVRVPDDAAQLVAVAGQLKYTHSRTTYITVCRL